MRMCENDLNAALMFIRVAGGQAGRGMDCGGCAVGPAAAGGAAAAPAAWAACSAAPSADAPSFQPTQTSFASNWPQQGCDEPVCLHAGTGGPCARFGGAVLLTNKGHQGVCASFSAPILFRQAPDRTSATFPLVLWWRKLPQACADLYPVPCGLSGSRLLLLSVPGT